MAARTPPELQASPRILHTALFAGALFAAPVTVLVRVLFRLIDLPGAFTGLRITAVVVLVGQAILVRAFRRRITPLAPMGDEDAWWNAHLSAALTIWALGEGVALLGSVFFFLAGDVVILAMILAGLLSLLLSRPERLMAP